MIRAENISPFDPCSTATWLARGRAPDHAEALARAWRDYPDLPPTSAAADRMARTRARVEAMKPVNDAIAAQAEAERQARNFSFTEERAIAGRGDERDTAILRGRDRYGYDWNQAIRYADGWHAAQAGWNHRAPSKSVERPAYDRGFADGGGDVDDLFDAARRTNLAAERTPIRLRPQIAARSFPSDWPKPSDGPRPTAWSRRVIILGDHPASALGRGEIFERFRETGGRYGGRAIILTAAHGFISGASTVPDGDELTAARADELIASAEQEDRLRALLAGMDVEDILVALHGEYLRVIDAHAAALPTCRNRERTRNTPLQVKAHVKLWMGRGRKAGKNVGAGHIRWSKATKGLTAKLGELTARYQGPAPGKGHLLSIEQCGALAHGFTSSDGDLLVPTIVVGSKARLRDEMARALRLFGGATRFAAR
ncbi:hypothetical protein [Sphingopyxis terrae]|uniref:hypothetical protein n=1 Tax=Sphingopyxis terrae TaxID=33052 RepID=UPI0009EE6CE7|nr:hypothetical protein [Sphingopyxis terrae]